MADEQRGEPPASEISEPQVSQVTSPNPETKPAKNPKRVAAGKARQAQKKLLSCGFHWQQLPFSNFWWRRWRRF